MQVATQSQIWVCGPGLMAARHAGRSRHDCMDELCVRSFAGVLLSSGAANDLLPQSVLHCCKQYPNSFWQSHAAQASKIIT